MTLSGGACTVFAVWDNVAAVCSLNSVTFIYFPALPWLQLPWLQLPWLRCFNDGRKSENFQETHEDLSENIQSRPHSKAAKLEIETRSFLP